MIHRTLVLRVTIGCIIRTFQLNLMTHNNNPTTQGIEMEPSQVLSQPQYHSETFILKKWKKCKVKGTTKQNFFLKPPCDTTD